MANLAYLQITRKCDQVCRFCSNPPSGWKDISLKSAMKLVDNYIKKGYDGLILTGGEPTKYPWLAEIVSYCSKKGFPARIITNGQKIAKADFLAKLVASGLRHLHISIYSHKEKVQDFLTQNKGSLKNIKRALANLSEYPFISIAANITFNKYNSNHLSGLARFLVENYPFIRHFSFNNLDPTSDRVQENLDTIPKLSDFELELNKTLTFLESRGKSFRVERVPLCYMAGFEYCSTETRKIVKNETRPLHFLDKRGARVEDDFYRDKAPQCQFCFLDEICAGLWQMDKYYSSKELYPVFVSTQPIIQRIRQNDN